MLSSRPFLLLIFFLMTAQLRPPEPFEGERPVASMAQLPDAEPVLYIGQDGTLQFQDISGEAVYSALAGLAGAHPALQVRTDARLDADRLALAMKLLAAIGHSRIELVVQVR